MHVLPTEWHQFHVTKMPNGEMINNYGHKTTVTAIGMSSVLVFSKCFRAGYFTFSQLKFKVNKGINL